MKRATLRDVGCNAVAAEWTFANWSLTVQLFFPFATQERRQALMA